MAISWLDIFKRGGAETRATVREQNMTLEQLMQLLCIDPDTPRENLSEATYFACLKLLSESIGKLPFKLMQNTKDNGIIKLTDHPLYHIVKHRPNPYMNSTFFWGSVEMARNHYGNAYVLATGTGRDTALWLLNNEHVRVWWDDAMLLSQVPSIWYIYTQPKTGKIIKYHHDEIMHYRTSMTIDGVCGLAVQDILTSTIVGSQKSQFQLNKFYDNGFTAKAVLQYTGSLNDDLTQKFVKGIEDYATGKNHEVKNIIPIPLGSTLQPLNIKLTDAQFLELKKHSALQIAAAFGIKPYQINDYEKASYASAEAQQLAFYVDTLQYILKQYEEETTSKRLTDQEISQGAFFKFNEGVILRADTKTQLESLRAAVQGTIYTPNEARALLNVPAKPGGDELMTNGTMLPLTKLGIAYQKKEDDA